MKKILFVFFALGFFFCFGTTNSLANSVADEKRETVRVTLEKILAKIEKGDSNVSVLRRQPFSVVFVKTGGGSEFRTYILEIEDGNKRHKGEHARFEIKLIEKVEKNSRVTHKKTRFSFYAIARDSPTIFGLAQKIKDIVVTREEPKLEAKKQIKLSKLKKIREISFD